MVICKWEVVNSQNIFAGFLTGDCLADIKGRLSVLNKSNKTNYKLSGKYIKMNEPSSSVHIIQRKGDWRRGVKHREVGK